MVACLARMLYRLKYILKDKIHLESNFRKINLFFSFLIFKTRNFVLKRQRSYCCVRLKFYVSLLSMSSDRSSYPTNLEKTRLLQVDTYLRSVIFIVDLGRGRETTMRVNRITAAHSSIIGAKKKKKNTVPIRWVITLYRDSYAPTTDSKNNNNNNNMQYNRFRCEVHVEIGTCTEARVG